jgi:hypothetical protein
VLQGRPDHIATALAISLVQFVQRKSQNLGVLANIFDKTAKQYILAKHFIDTVQYAAWDSPATVLRSPILSQSIALQHDQASGVIWLSSQLQDRDPQGRITITNLKGTPVATVAGYTQLLKPVSSAWLQLAPFVQDIIFEDSISARAAMPTLKCKVIRPELATSPGAIPRLGLLSGPGCPLGKHLARMLAQAGGLRNSTFFRPFGQGYMPAIDRFQLIIPSLRWPYWYEGNIDMVLMPWSVGDVTDKIADGMHWLMGPKHLKVCSSVIISMMPACIFMLLWIQLLTAINPITEALASPDPISRIGTGKFKPTFDHVLSGFQASQLKEFLAT